LFKISGVQEDSFGVGLSELEMNRKENFNPILKKEIPLKSKKKYES
jgi:hypothetical protein